MKASNISAIPDIAIQELLETVPFSSSKQNLLPDTIKAAFCLFHKATEPSSPIVEYTADNDGLPPGWERVESRSRKGEYSYLNKANGKRQMILPREAVPGFSNPAKVVLASVAIAGQVDAHLSFSKFCNECLRDFSGSPGFNSEDMTKAVFRSHLTAMKFVIEWASFCIDFQ